MAESRLSEEQQKKFALDQFLEAWDKACENGVEADLLCEVMIYLAITDLVGERPEPTLQCPAGCDCSQGVILGDDPLNLIAYSIGLDKSSPALGSGGDAGEEVHRRFKMIG